MRVITAMYVGTVMTFAAGCANIVHESAPPAPPAPLASNVRANSSYADFEWRRVHLASSGRFLTRDEFDAPSSTLLVDLLRHRFPGFCRTRDARNSALEMTDGACPIDVYVNGLWAPTALDALRPHDIAGAEYYQAAFAPPQFRRTMHAAPVLVLWLQP